MNLRKIMFVLFLLFAVNSISAQTAKFKFGVKGGLNLSTALVHDGDSKFKQGYHIGGTVDFLLSSKVELQSGLFFSKTGAKINDENFTSIRGADLSKIKRPYSIHTYNTSYIKLPLHVAFRKSISDNLNFNIGFGTYLGYAIEGKIKEKRPGGSFGSPIVSENGEVTWINEIEYDMFFRYRSNGKTQQRRRTEFRRFDFGAGANADIEFHKFVLGAGFEYGTNIYDTEHYGGYKYRNINISISTGYRF